MKIKPDQTKSYFSADQALSDSGFEYYGQGFGPENAVGKRKKYEVFEKDNQHYAFQSMDHYNTTIFSITLKEIDIRYLDF